MKTPNYNRKGIFTLWDGLDDKSKGFIRSIMPEGWKPPVDSKEAERVMKMKPKGRFKP